MGGSPLLRLVDAVTIPVPDLPDATTEIVLTTEVEYAPSWLVTSLDEALDRITAAGGHVIDSPSDIPVGRLAVVADPFGNRLVLLDLSRGRYVTNADHEVIGVVEPRTC